MRARGASLTARWVASHRARLGALRPTFPGGDAEAEEALYKGLSNPVLLLPGTAPSGMMTRTKFTDCETMAALTRGVQQVVILGAGYDGRALRFGGSARWIEVDHPATQGDKRRRVAAVGKPTEHITFAPVDLVVDDLDQALSAAGHRTDLPTLFFAEGLVAYLPIDTTRKVFSVIKRRAAEGSTFVCNFRVIPRTGVRGRSLRAGIDVLLAVIGERRRATFYEGDPEALLMSSGWMPIRMDTSSPNRLDQGTYLLLAAAEPDH